MCSVCEKGFRLHLYRVICNVYSSPCHLACTKFHHNDSIMADGGDGADDDDKNTADARRDDAKNEEDQHANREKGTVSPANFHPGNYGRMFNMRRV